jgi:hypothetical protein
MHTKSTRPPKIGHKKKSFKSQNNAKLPQERPKNLTKYLVFKHPKMAFYFWTKPFGACKKKGKTRPNQGGMVLGYLAP